MFYNLCYLKPCVFQSVEYESHCISIKQNMSSGRRNEFKCSVLWKAFTAHNYKLERFRAGFLSEIRNRILLENYTLIKN